MKKPKQNRSSRTKRTPTSSNHHPFPGRLIVVGGQCSKVGKTSLIVDLIKAFPKFKWTAVKITPYAESGCPVKGEKCRCTRGEHTFAIRTEISRRGKFDTLRFLTAGAARAIWVQTKAGHFKDALSPLASELVKARNVLIESNAIVKHWRADLFLLVLDPRKADFKTSARTVLSHVDGFVFRSPSLDISSKSGPAIPKSGRPKFLQPIGDALPRALRDMVRQRFRGDGHLKG